MANILHNINLFLTNDMAKFRALSRLATLKLANSVWYRSKWAWIGFLPLEWLYRIALIVKKQQGKDAVAFHIPIIVVGNITVGGTGKSPFVIALAQLLKKQGYTPGIISRGYRGERVHPELPLSVTSNSNPRLVGDEPVMIARQTQLPLVVSSDRVRATRFLLERFPQCDLVISDDGLQHYRLGRDITICLVDGMRRFGNKRCLPAGPLREPLSVLPSFDFVLQNEGEDSTLAMQDEGFINLQNPEIKKDARAFAGQTVHAVAGIGNPDRFFNRLKRLGLDIIPHVFPDHYLFSATDLQFKEQFPIVMTEKDAVKCAHIAGSDTWFLRVKLELSKSLKEQLIKKLFSLAKK